jgi:GNAT superfamily N-acetyltransferase
MTSSLLEESGLGEWVPLADGAAVGVREMRGDDIPRLRRLHTRLSRRTAYRRFMTPTPRLSERAVAYFADVDHLGREALVATSGDDIVAIAQYHQTAGTTEAEVAILVEDAWQRRGVGRILIKRLIERARRRGIRVFTGTMLSENPAAIALLRVFFPDAATEVNGPELTFRASLAPSGIRSLDPALFEPRSSTSTLPRSA